MIATSQKLEHTQRLESLGVLAGGIAHDFNNLLTTIMGNNDMARRKLHSDNDDIKTNLQRIHSACQHAATLCNQMLAYSGKGRFLVKSLHPSGLVREIARLMEVSIHKNTTIHYQLEEQLPIIQGDPAQLQQVVLNLITNASEAIESDLGEITITTGVIQATAEQLASSRTRDSLAAGDYVHITISDNGCGMDKVTLDKIFDPFFTTKLTGRGLGMSAILGIIRSHHGAILIDSTPGKGTTFQILLPASNTTPHAISDESPENFTAESNSQQQQCILVVDDEIDIREVTCTILEDIGYQSIPAANGMEAIELYRQHQNDIHAVLLDMTMPKMNGRACFAELTAINPDVRVILCSGYAEQELHEQFFEKTPASFLQKPYTPDTLLQHIQQCLQE